MKHVLAAVDFSGLSSLVVGQAADLARAFEASLTLVHLAAPDPDFVGYEPGPQTVRDSRAQELRSEHRRLQELADGLRSRGVEAKALLVQGPTIEGILAEADRLQADLIVMGCHGKGPLSRVFLGSVSEGVLRKSSRPVLIVPATP